MSSYVEKVMVPGESLCYRGQASLWAHFGRLFMAVFFIITGAALAYSTQVIWLAALALIGLWLFLLVYIQVKSTELAITNKRIIVKFGFIRRDTTEINLLKVESVQVEQTLLGRILNFGTIIVSAGGGPMAPVPYIHAPLEFRKHFVMATDQQQA